MAKPFIMPSRYTRRQLLRLAPALAGPALCFYMPFYDLRWRHTPAAVIREGDWKLIESFGDYIDQDDAYTYKLGHRLELFNLKNDLGERDNLAAREPERVKRMQRTLHEWIRASGAEVPALNPRFDPKRARVETSRKSVKG